MGRRVRCSSEARMVRREREPGAGGAAGLRLGRQPGGPAAARAGRRPRRPGRGAGRAGRRRRTPARGARARSRSPTSCSPPTPRGWSASRRRRGGRGDRRHRAGAGPDPLRARARRLRGDRQQGAARRGRRDALRGRRARPVATSTSRPRWPGRSRSCGRCASRSPATGCGGCSASSTAPPTSSSTGWTPPAPASPRRWRRRRQLGYAEADPTADVEGFDAAAKAAILASLAFHTRVVAADVHREGISEVTAADVASAREMGCVVKLLAICDAGRRARAARPSRPGCTPR